MAEPSVTSESDGEITMRQVDEAHHSERQRESRGEQRVQAAQQHTLHERVDPHHHETPKYDAVMASRDSSPGVPESDTRPSSMQ